MKKFGTNIHFKNMVYNVIVTLCFAVLSIIVPDLNNVALTIIIMLNLIYLCIIIADYIDFRRKNARIK